MIATDKGRMPPPLSPLVEALLAHERVPLSQPEIVRARILARARESMRTSPPATLSPRGMIVSGRRLLLAAAAGITLLAGAAAAYQMLARPTLPLPQKLGPTKVTKQIPVEPPTPQTVAEPTALKQAEAAVPAPAVTPVRSPLATATATAIAPPGRRSGSVNKREGGMEELQLLGRARQADAHGDYTEVLALVADHERTYPAGRLSEEREVLRVKALVGLDRGGEARRAAVKFRRQFPRSVLLPKIEDMLASLR